MLGRGPVPVQPPTDLAPVVAFARSVWRVLPAVFPRLEAWLGGDKRSREALASVTDRLTAMRAFSLIQHLALARLIDAFYVADVDFCLLKASAVRLSAYRKPLDRCGLDLDIAVPRAQIRVAEQVALKQGFIEAQFDWDSRRFSRADSGLRHAVEVAHYELGFLARRCAPVGLTQKTEAAIARDLDESPMWHRAQDGRLACYVTIDLHHGLSQEVPVESLVRTASQTLWEGRSVPVPLLGWQLYHLIFKLYWEGVHEYGKGLYQYADIVRLVSCIPESEQRRCRTLLDRQRLGAAGYYVLRRLPDTFGISLPPTLADMLESGRTPEPGLRPLDANDFGDMWPKLFGHR